MDQHDTKLRAETARRRRLGLASEPSSQPAEPG
jgi:hypothetical protein